MRNIIKYNGGPKVFSGSVILFCVLFNLAQAQTEKDISTMNKGIELSHLLVGDAIPEELWNMPLQVINHAEGENQIKLNTYRGKVIILDFWATWCAPCLAMFPVVHRLEKQFAGDITFLPVSFEDIPVLQSFLDRRKANNPQERSISTAIGTKQLLGYFPHNVLPHYVWISADGRFLGASDYTAVHPANIDLALANQLQFKPIKKVKRAYNTKEPVLRAVNGLSDKNIRFYSVFGGYEEGISPIMTRYTDIVDKRLSKLSFVNIHFMQMVQFAYNRNDQLFPQNRIHFDLKDKDILNFSPQEENQQTWREKNLYFYEVVGQGSTEELGRLMQADLGKFFPQYKMYTAFKEVPCWVLKELSPQRIPKTKGGERISRIDANGAKLVNTSVYDLFFHLNFHLFQNGEFPFVYDVKSTDHVDLEIVCRMTDMNDINKALSSYGLQFIKEVRPVELLFIEDAIKKGGLQ